MASTPVPLAAVTVRRPWTPSVRAVRTFVTGVAALYALFNVGWIGCVMLAGWSPLMSWWPNNAFVKATVLPQITQLDSRGELICAGSVCHQLAETMAVTAVPLWIRAVSALAVLAEVMGVMLALIGARRALALVAAGTPFEAAVPRALRPLVTWPAFGAVRAWVNELNDRPVQDDQTRVISLGANPLHLNLPLLTTGLVVGCLVVGFREGSRLQKDAEGVV